ncbi:MAG: uracil-DNA glycosylase family protein, partial [Candidatus Parvarchaeum sp.]
MKHFYTLYSGGKDLYELNKSLWEADHQIQPGYFNLPHVLIVGANPRLVTEDMKDPFKFMFDLSDYDEFENTYRDCISTTPFGATAKTLNILCDLRSEYVSFTNVVKAPTTSENDITQEMKDKYINITKKQIELFKPLIVITLGTFAKNALIGEDAEFNHLYEINNIYYYPLYHYSYLLRHGAKKLTDYYAQSKAEINEILKTHALIQITNRTIFYRDIDGVKQSYPNPIQFVPAYIQSPTGKYTSIYDEPLDVAPAGSIAPYEHGLQPADAFGIGRK